MQHAAGVNWHNRPGPTGGRSALHSVKRRQPRKSVVPAQYLATSKAVAADSMNIWPRNIKPLGVHSAPALGAKDLDKMATFFVNLEANPGSAPVGGNLPQSAIDKALAAMSLIAKTTDTSV